MARTGTPATRHVAAVERAAAVLDALADGGELGTNELARRTGLHPSSVSRLLATLVHGGLVEHVVETGRYRLGPPARPARERRARPARPARGRPSAPARARRGDRRDGHALGAGRSGRDHRRLRPERLLRAGRRARRAAERRPRDGDREGGARFRHGGPPAGAPRAYTERTVVDRAELAREVDRVRGRAGRSAVGEREDDLNAVAAPVHGAEGSSPRYSGSRGPPRASRARRSRARSGRYWSMQRRSPTL